MPADGDVEADGEDDLGLIDKGASNRDLNDGESTLMDSNVSR